MKTDVLEKTKTITVSDWDPAEDIETKEAVIAVIDVVLEENDPAFLLSAMGDIVRSEGFTKIARERGISREALLQSIAPDGTLTLDSVVKLLDIVGYRLKLEPKTA